MFRNKIYLYGLGIGLIVGAVLLQLMIISSKYSQTDTIANVTSNIPIEELDAQKLKAEAAKSFQVFDKNVKVYIQADFDAELQKKLKEEKDKLPTASSSPAKRTYLYIQPNLPASSVAELLYKAEIVTDRRAFEEALIKQDVTNKMQVGFHMFEGAPDLQQIIKNLTSEQ